MGLFSKKNGRSAGTGPAATSPRYGLLLVDDEILNLTTLASLLEDEYRVITASSGQEALRLLDDPTVAASVQVIVSDQRMPGMTGIELLSQTRLRWPQIKRLLLTGYTDIDAIINAINDAAVYKYIRKPVESHELMLTLARALEAWQLEQDNHHLLDELRLALDRLALLDADKLDFLRYLAHEMNTPLNWLSATQVVDRDSLGQEVQEILGYVDQGQERLRALVAAVLRYFQLAGLKPGGSQGLVDLPLLLREKLLDCQAHTPPVSVQLELPQTLTLESDPALLGEALEHLLENALSHAARHPEPQVRVSLQVSQGSISLDVHNSGPGLDEDRLGQLLRPFRFGSDHGELGFGISLATVKAIALALGGDVQASCAGPGQGVCLHLRLPQLSKTPPATALVATPA